MVGNANELLQAITMEQLSNSIEDYRTPLLLVASTSTDPSDTDYIVKTG